MKFLLGIAGSTAAIVWATSGSSDIMTTAQTGIYVIGGLVIVGLVGMLLTTRR